MSRTIDSVKFENYCLIITWREEKGKKTIKKYKLALTTAEKIFEYRKTGKAGFVFKEKDKLYFTPIPKNVNMYLKPIDRNHLCRCDCRRATAASDNSGGCAKVRDWFWDVCIHRGYSFESAAVYSKKIETYDFIKLGYQTFGTIEDCLYVVECDNYEKQDQPTVSTFQRFKTKLTLAELAENSERIKYLKKQIRGL